MQAGMHIVYEKKNALYLWIVSILIINVEYCMLCHTEKSIVQIYYSCASEHRLYRKVSTIKITVDTLLETVLQLITRQIIDHVFS
jgi:hypothetical protein